jgi:malate dehydrogenase
MVPDYDNALIGGSPATEVIDDADWFENDFIPTVQQRGKAVIDARGASSAASAANALIDHVRDWCGGPRRPMASGCRWPCRPTAPTACRRADLRVPGHHRRCRWTYQIVQGIELSDGARAKLDRSVAELTEEREAVADML